MSCIKSQAPGDGDPLCTEEIVDGIRNPFFILHPGYSANERPLMDSRDYLRLLESSGGVYLPWQSVDIDNINSEDLVSQVRICLLSIRLC